MFTIDYAKNPQFENAEGTSICLTVKFNEIETELPFSATPFDCYEYGRDLYARALEGEFGTIKEYIAPSQPTTTGTQTL